MANTVYFGKQGEDVRNCSARRLKLSEGGVHSHKAETKSILAAPNFCKG